MILICSLVIIIFLHELGHLLAAKLCKCGVKTFSVGFGPKIWGLKFGKTYYQIAPMLLGGYCELQGEMFYSKSKYAFTNKTYSQKIFISLAGILMNVLSGLISYYLFLITYNSIFFYFAYYSIAIGLSNLLPIPALDGSFIFAFLLEKKLGKKKAYKVISSLFSKWLRWLLILNILSIPYLGWLIWTGAIK